MWILVVVDRFQADPLCQKAELTWFQAQTLCRRRGTDARVEPELPDEANRTLVVRCRDAACFAILLQGCGIVVEFLLRCDAASRRTGRACGRVSPRDLLEFRVAFLAGEGPYSGLILLRVHV